MLLKQTQVPNLISEFRGKTKDYGARKLEKRIKEVFVGVGRQHIQQQINQDEEHHVARPIYDNKTRRTQQNRADEDGLTSNMVSL